MSSGKLDIQRWFKDAELIAAVAPGRELFGLLSRMLTLPTDFAALVTRAAGDRVLVEPGREIAGEGVREVLFLRTSPLELTFLRGGLTSRDNYLCQANVTLRVMLVPERSEAESFRRTVLGSSRFVRLPAVVRYLAPVLAEALAALAGQQEVENLVDGQCHEAAAEAMRQALETPCFEAGLALTGRIDVGFESEALRAVRAQQAATIRRLDEHAAQEQVRAALIEARAKHLNELEATLHRLQELAAATPQAALPDLLRTFGESERAKLYQALFESQAIVPATRWVVVASGQELLFFAPDSFDAPARRMTLEGPIGPLRSIQALCCPESAIGPAHEEGRSLTVTARNADSALSTQRSALRLFVGAAQGVYELGVEASAAETVYVTPASGEVRGGVNAVALHGDWVFATHSELGLLRWSYAQPESCTRCLEDLTGGASAVRNVHAAGDRVVFSVDERIVSFVPHDENDRRIFTGSASVITAALAVGADTFAGNADGQILHWPDGRTASPTVLHGGSRRPAESLALLTTGGVPRLFFTDTTLAVFARVLGDTFTCRYEAGGQTLRRAEVAPDLIVAIDDPRHHLLIWLPNRPAHPSAVLRLARLTGHSIQDVTLVPLEA